MPLKPLYLTSLENTELEYLASCLKTKTQEETIKVSIQIMISLFQSLPDADGCVKIKVK